MSLEMVAMDLLTYYAQAQTKLVQVVAVVLLLLVGQHLEQEGLVVVVLELKTQLEIMQQ
jgi:hypothetical protein